MFALTRQGLAAILVGADTVGLIPRHIPQAIVAEEVEADTVVVMVDAAAVETEEVEVVEAAMAEAVVDTLAVRL